MQRLAILFFVLCLVPNLLAGDDPRETASRLIDRMAEQGGGEESKADAAESILKMGVQAIPGLIEHVQDPRRYGTVSSASGACFNLPRGAPLPNECGAKKKVTIGEKCEELLYRLLTPRKPPRSCKDVHAKAWFQPPFEIRDWAEWRKENQDRSLDELHQKASTLIDRFCRSGGFAPVAWE